MKIGDWADDAACKGKTDLFFPEQGDSVRYRAAVAICAQCSVLEQCRTYGLANAERFGIWGGLSSANRQQVRNPREPRPVTHPSWKAYQTGCRCEPCRTMNADYMRARRIRIRQERTVTHDTHTKNTSN